MTQTGDRVEENNARFSDMYKVLRGSVWSRETASPSCQEAWSPENPAFGQCAVTALLMQDEYGGDILRTVVDGFGSHYYNRFPDGSEVDFTRGQFPSGTVVPPGQTVDRDYILRSPRAVGAQTPERYALARGRLSTRLSILCVGC